MAGISVGRAAQLKAAIEHTLMRGFLLTVGTYHRRSQCRRAHMYNYTLLGIWSLNNCSIRAAISCNFRGCIYGAISLDSG